MMGLLKLISLWQQRLEYNSALHKIDIGSTEQEMRQTPEGRQELAEFYSETFPKMLTIKEINDGPDSN